MSNRSRKMTPPPPRTSSTTSTIIQDYNKRLQYTAHSTCGLWAKPQQYLKIDINILKVTTIVLWKQKKVVISCSLAPHSVLLQEKVVNSLREVTKSLPDSETHW